MILESKKKRNKKLRKQLNDVFVDVIKVFLFTQNWLKDEHKKQAKDEDLKRGASLYPINRIKAKSL